jgi:hypothetical protein
MVSLKFCQSKQICSSFLSHSPVALLTLILHQRLNMPKSSDINELTDGGKNAGNKGSVLARQKGKTSLFESFYVLEGR